MSANKNLWLATASAVVLLMAAPAMAQTDANVTIVEPDGPAETAGEAVDNAAAATADAADDAADATAEAAGDAADAAEQSAEAAGDAAADAADAAEETGDAMADAAETDAEEVADGTPVQGQIFEQSPDTYLASTLMDAVVMNAADEEIGDVNDMILSAEGQVEGVVIGVGGFLGVGEKNVAIELSRLEITEDEDGELTFMLDTTAEELEAAPEFMTTEDAEMEAESAATPTTGTGATGMGATTGTGMGTAPATGTAN